MNVLDSLVAHVAEQLRGDAPDHHSFPLDPDAFEYVHERSPSAAMQALLAKPMAQQLGRGVCRWLANGHEILVLDTDGDAGYVAVLSPAGDDVGFGAFVTGGVTWLARDEWLRRVAAG